MASNVSAERLVVFLKKIIKRVSSRVTSGFPSNIRSVAELEKGIMESSMAISWLIDMPLEHLFKI